MLYFEPTNNHLCLVPLASVRVTIVRPSTRGSASPGGRAPERLRVLRQRQHTRASAALPGRGPLTVGERLAKHLLQR